MYTGAGAGVVTLEALKQGHSHYAADEGTLEALRQGAGDYELQTRVDAMRELQKEVDDMRAGAETLEALKQGLSYDSARCCRAQRKLSAQVHIIKSRCA